MSKSIVWAVLALVLAGLIGHKVGHWRAVADASEAAQAAAATIQRQTEDIATLKLAIADQNKDIAVAEAQAEGARLIQAEAQRRADDAAAISQSRLNKLDKLLDSAKTAGDVLARYWEVRQ